LSDARTLGEILAKRFAALAESDQVRAYRAWHAIAGGELAKVTAPGRLRDGTLVIECESSVWATELSFMAPDLLRRLRAVDPETPVQRLRFLVRPPRW